TFFSPMKKICGLTVPLLGSNAISMPASSLYDQSILKRTGPDTFATGYGTTGMLPVSHSLYVSPPWLFGPLIFHPAATSLRATAVLRKSPATVVAGLSGGTVFGFTVGFGPTAFWMAADWLWAFGELLLGASSTIATTIPAIRTSAPAHGASRFNRK